jgi:hypothetical protein
MSKFATVTVTVRGTDFPFTVKTASAAKRVKRLIEAMQLPHVGDITITSHSVDFEEVSDVLQKVFAKSVTAGLGDTES